MVKTVVRVIVREWIRTALWFRFRKIQMVFDTPLPLQGPAILAGNHQNAVLDSMTLATWPPRVPFTLSRASLFENPMGRGLLDAVRMVPVYRFRDGFEGMRRNREAFDRFAQVLADDGWLLLFPEGSHVLRYTLRPFQKGLARIVFFAQEKEGWKREIPVFPVGLQYESHTTFGSRLLIRFGPPVSSLGLGELYSENPKQAERELTARLHGELSRILVLPPPEEEDYEAAMKRWRENKGRFPDLLDQVRSDRALMARPGEAARARGGGSDPPGPEAGNSPGPRGRAAAMVRKTAGFGLSLPGVILHLPVILATLAVEKAAVRDRHLVPAARFLMGMFFTPAWYVAVAGIGYGVGGSVAGALGVLLSLPLFLWVWSRSWHWTC